jgi:hypothetical protein
MKKFLFLIILMLFVSPIYAESVVGHIGGQNTSNVNDWEIWEPNGDIRPGVDSRSNIGSNTYRVAVGYFDEIVVGTKQRIPFTVADFLLNTPAALTASTQPGLELDNGRTSIVWADGETTPVQVSFKVPYGYASGGNFYILASSSAQSDGTCGIGWGIYDNTVGSAWDTTRWNGTPATVEGTATPDLVSLTATAFGTAISAGDEITIDIWRWDGNTSDGQSTGTGDLEIYGAYFE